MHQFFPAGGQLRFRILEHDPELTPKTVHAKKICPSRKAPPPASKYREASWSARAQRRFGLAAQKPWYDPRFN